LDVLGSNAQLFGRRLAKLRPRTLADVDLARQYGDDAERVDVKSFRKGPIAPAAAAALAAAAAPLGRR
jgi:hypothetical protein